MNICLLFGAGFSSTKNIEKGSIVLCCLIFQIFVTIRPSLSVSVFDSFNVEGIVHFLQCYFINSFFNL
jgi:hypothetical protein